MTAGVPAAPAWEAWEIKIVTEMAAARKTDRAIADKLGRTRKAVAALRRRLKIEAGRRQNGATGSPLRCDAPVKADPLANWWRKFPDIAAQAASLTVEETMARVVERVSR